MNIGNRFFSIEQTVTSFLSFMEDRKDAFMKIQTFLDNLEKEPCKKVSHKLRYEALKINGEKVPHYTCTMYMFIKWVFLDFLYTFILCKMLALGQY